MKFIFGKKESQTSDTPTTDTTSSSTLDHKPSTVSIGIIDRLRNKTDAINEATQVYQLGLFIMLTGVIFFALSLLFLPMVMLKPHKFVALNGIGTMSIFISIILMRRKTAGTFLLSKDVVLFTIAYFASFVMEIYFSTINPRYLFVFIAFAVNVVSLFYIIAKFFVKSSFVLRQVFKTTISGFQKTVGRVFNGSSGPELPF